MLSMMAAPTAQAVSDEVAVQLLERLGELEKEVSHLRGENEALHNELQGIKTTQREGFLEVDERVSGLEKTTAPAPAAVASPDPVRTVSPADFPALEDPALPEEIRPVAAPVAVDSGQSFNTTAGGSVSDPEGRKAVAPAVEFNAAGTDKSTEKVEKVSPDSPESYYFYGTEDKNKDKSVNAAPAADRKAAPVAISGSTAALPDAHKAKAEYNQAYKALVTDPGSAVPAFRAFLSKYPDHELAANAQYWLGEALYARKDYSGATEEFMAVLKNHKSSPKAPGAALKLGYSFYELRQWDFARRTLEDTIRFFPGSNAASLAKHRLKKMTAEGH